MRHSVSLLALCLLISSSGAVLAKRHDKGVPPGLAKKGGVPPGLAKKGGLPPGLAKKFGPTVPQQAYIAIDPRHDDCAWFLVGDRWVLRRDFDPGVRAEVRQVLSLPPAPPPVPLPNVDIHVHLRVVVFNNG